MSNMVVRLFINSASCAFLFGMWQGNVYAGLWMMTACGFLLSAVDYLKEQPK